MSSAPSKAPSAALRDRRGSDSASERAPLAAPVAGAGRQLQVYGTSEKDREDSTVTAATDSEHKKARDEFAQPGGGVIPTWRHRTYVLLNGRDLWAVWCSRLLIALIFLNIIVFIISTEKPFYTDHKGIFDVIDGLSVAIFTIEYFLRLWSIVEHKQHSDGWRGRVRYVFSFYALVDFVAIFPYYISLAFPVGTIPVTTVLRVFRVFRILKTEQYTNAFTSLRRVVQSNSEILLVALSVAGILLLLTSSFLYYAQGQGGDGSSDSNSYGSIIKCMFVAVLMLTGQGVPENVDGLPYYTKIVIACTAFFSVAVFAIPAAMLAWGFEAEAERLVKKQKKVKKAKEACRKMGVIYVPQDENDDDDKSDSSGSDSDDDKDKGKKSRKHSIERVDSKDGTICPHCDGRGRIPTQTATSTIVA